MPVRIVILASVLSLVLNGGSLGAQQLPDDGEALPRDTGAIVGTLPNGLRYYVRRSAKPALRAELRLVVRAGSAMEDDDQRGVAHFVEHLAFQGTARFQRHDLIDALESAGLRFGADLNATTTLDNTTYQLRVPTDPSDPSASAFVTALDVLADWAGGITFDSAAVTAERGVILEEWRRGLSADGRIRERQFSVLYQDSRYANRLPIGTPESIMAMTRNKLLQFYHDWYRPDLMAIVAVGDFDPAAVEALIQARFAGLVNPPVPRPRPVVGIPDNIAPRISIVADSEMTRAGIAVTYKIPLAPSATTGDFRRALARVLFVSALNLRLTELARLPGAPILGARASYGALGEMAGAFTLSAETRPDAILTGARALFAEVERIARFGITDVERDRIERTLRGTADNAYAERENVPAAQFAATYVTQFLTQEPVLGIAEHRALLARELPRVSDADVRASAAAWRAEANRVILVSLPVKEALIPDRQSLVALFGSVQHEPLMPYEARSVTAPLLATLPTAGRIAETRSLPHDITMWTLSNGMTVYFRRTGNTADKVFFRASGTGGYLHDLDQGHVPAATAAQVVTLGGYGALSSAELQGRLAGRAVQVSVEIGPYSQGLSGGASTGDLETAFQLVYLAVNAPRADSVVVAAYQRQLRAAFEGAATAEQAFQDTIVATMTQHHPLARLSAPAWIDSIDVVRSLAVYRDRFRDVSGLRMVVVGNVSPDTLAPLIERYVASLPGGGRREGVVDSGIRAPTGMIHKTVTGGREPRTLTVLGFGGPFVLSRANEWNVYALSKVIELRLTDRLRQQLGGTYAVSVQMTIDPDPTPRYNITIQFASAPDRADELTRATFTELETLQHAPARDADVQKIREAELLGFAAAIDGDAYWLSAIASFARYDLPFDDLTSDAHIRHWQAADVQAAARAYLDLARCARFDLIPAPSTAP